MSLLVFSAQRLSIFDFKTKSQAVFNSKYIYTTILYEHNIVTSIDCEHLSRITCVVYLWLIENCNVFRVYGTSAVHPLNCSTAALPPAVW